MPKRSTASRRDTKRGPESAAAPTRTGKRKPRSSAAAATGDRPTDAAATSIRLGPLLRKALVARGLSARELARRIRVSASLISLIERDLTMPSVVTLFAIANELGLVIDDLFKSVETAGRPAGRRDASPARTLAPRGPVQRRDDRAVIRLNTGVRWERLTPSPDDYVEFLYVVYEVGAETADDGQLFRHSGQEYGVVISGRLGIQIGFERYELAAGDSVSFDAQTPHRLWTIGDTPATAIFAVLGRHGDGRTPHGGRRTATPSAATRLAEPVDG